MRSYTSVLPLSELSAVTSDLVGVSLTPQALYPFQDDDLCMAERLNRVVHQDDTHGDTCEERKAAAKATIQPHTTNLTLTWADIRPIFENLYLIDRLTLNQTIDKIRYQHGFFASDQQYKKKIRDWNLSKITKATEKDAAIQKVLQAIDNGQEMKLVAGPELNKIRRWARARHKEGKVMDDDLNRILNASKYTQKHSSNSSIKPACSVVPVYTPESSPKTPAVSPRTPDSTGTIPTPIELPLLDKLYLTVPTLTAKYNSKYFIGVRDEEQKLAFTLDEALVNWKLNAYDKARTSFIKASELIRRQMQMNAMPELTLIYYLIPEAWPGCMPVFHTLARFIQMATDEILGGEHPFAIFVSLLQATVSSAQRGMTVWKDIFESLRLTVQNRDQWTDASIYRSRFCRRNGQPDLAIAVCRNTLAGLESLGRVPDHLKIDLCLELAESLESEGDYREAATTFQETVQIASKRPRKYQEYRIRALERLAQIHEVHFWNFAQAQAFYVEAFQICVVGLGIEDFETMYILRELVYFCQRHDLVIDTIVCPETLSRACTYAEQSTQGAWFS